MRRDVGKAKRRSGLRAAWPALAVLACLVAEAAGFVVLHQSMHDYRTPVVGGSAYR